jgi:hypothetical protein
LSLVGTFPLTFYPQTPFKPSTSPLCHLRPEDGQSMFLRKVGIGLRKKYGAKTQGNTNILYINFRFYQLPTKIKIFKRTYLAPATEILYLVWDYLTILFNCIGYTK